jgi:PAS domain S-box-containing protein
MNKFDSHSDLPPDGHFAPADGAPAESAASAPDTTAADRHASDGGLGPADHDAARWRALAEVSPDFMILTDLEGRIEYLNRTTGRATVESYVGKDVFALLRTSAIDVLKECLERVITSKKIDQCDVEYVTPDGETRLAEVRVGPVLAETTVVGLALNGRDVTQAPVSHAQPLDARPLPSSTGSALGGPPSRDDLSDQSLADSFQYAPPASHVPAELQGDCDSSNLNVPDAGALQRAHADTMLRRALDELQHLTASLSAGLWSLRLAPDGGWHEHYRSPVMESITGRADSYFQDDVQQWLQTIHVDDQASVLDALQRLQRSAPTRDEVEYRIILPDGSLRWVRNSTISRRLPDGSVRLDGVLADITDRKRAEEAVQLAEDQRRNHLDELAHAGRLSTMGQLVAAIAHEMNQPLYAISNYAGACHNALQQRPDAARERVLNWVKEIDNQARRASLVISKVGDFVRKSPAQRSTLNLNALILDSLDLLRLEARSHQVRLILELTSPAPNVLADRVQIQQTIVNLVRNAFDALDDVPPAERRVVVRTEQNGARARVLVEDCGKGISPEDHKQLFEPFFTTKSKGMGMGLAICQSIVEAHGGTLRAVDNPQAGVTFHFDLPAQTDPGLG